MRRVVGARGDVEEEGFLRRDRSRPAQPGDRPIHEILCEMIIRVRARDELVVFVQGRMPLVHVTAHEAVEVVEAEAARPAIEGAGLAGLPVGRVVVLAEPGGGVAVLAENLGDRADALGDDAGVAVVAGRSLGDDARAGDVVVPAGEQGRAGRRAEGGGVEPRITQAVGGHAVERRRRHLASKGPELAVAGVIDQDEHDVWRALRRPGWLRKLRRIAVQDRAPDAALEAKVLNGRAVPGLGGTVVASRAGLRESVPRQWRPEVRCWRSARARCGTVVWFSWLCVPAWTEVLTSRSATSVTDLIQDFNLLRRSIPDPGG